MSAAISMTPVRCAGLERTTGASGDGGGAALAASTVDILEPVPRRFVFRLFNQDTVAIPHIARLLGVVCTVCGDFTCFGGVAFCPEECPGWRGNFSLADAWAKVFSRAPAHTAMLCRCSSGCEERLHGAGVAQLVAQRTCNASVASSSPISISFSPRPLRPSPLRYWGFLNGVAE